MTRPLLPLLALCLLLLLAPQPASAEKAWMKEEGYKRLLRAEAKTLKPLLEAALKADYRRQAWYLADRIVSADPDDELATQTLEKWGIEELQLGAPLKKAWDKKLTGVLKRMGDDYFHFGETLEAAGIDPLDYYPINVRAQAYGSVAGPLVSSMQQSGYMWMGTYGHEEEKVVREILGPELSEQVTFPPEWDDEYLRFRSVWSECRVVEAGNWRIVTDLKYDEALRALKRCADVERWVVKRLGKGKPLDVVNTIVLFRDRETYVKVGKDLVRKRYRDPFVLSSGFWIDKYNRAFVASTDSRNEWLGEMVTMQGMVVRAMARTRYARAAGPRITGPGEWYLQGLRGLGEALRYEDRAKGTMTLDIGSSWRLAAARALQDQEALIPWGEMFDYTEKRRLAAERPETTTIAMRGATYELKGVDTVSAQATTFVMAVFRSDKKKGPKALAKLLGELYKKGTLDDPWKPLKWKPVELIVAMNGVLKAVEAPKK
ncbi:MAG: hypothetical protein QNJ98_00520 [Planctomycetota bacterium]|nr:hypothetical protein [Planctomycetota bacterium]